jgi:hypothetical protein
MNKDINEAVMQLIKKAKAINFKDNEVMFLLDNGLYILKLIENPAKNEVTYIGFLYYQPINGNIIMLYENQSIEISATKLGLINYIFA